jgi:isoquinoline 1-oxidoreductase beta subunit
MTTSAPKKRRITRRGFLIGLGVGGGLLALGGWLGLPKLQLELAELVDGIGGAPANFPKEPNVWFTLQPDNRVLIAMPKIEMGQGIHTAIAQIAAEELRISWDQVLIEVSSSTAATRDAGGTNGSFSVASLFTPLREIGATMREMLRLAAAEQLSVAPADLQINAGVISVTADPSRTLRYVDIAAGRSSWPEVENVTLTPPEQWQLIGQSVPRLDLPAKIRGEAIYGYDARLPGMLFGAVARPPVIGAKLLKAAPGTAMQRSGVVQVVIEDDFVGVVAETRLTAMQAVNDLELEWERPATPVQQADVEAALQIAPGQGTVIQSVGDAAGALTGRNDAISAEYWTPLAAHATLEMQAALVDVQPERVRAFVSTQSPVMVANELAGLLGRDAATVDVTPTYLGGGKGRKIIVEVAAEAARLSRAVQRPVHVGWTRAEEFRNGYLRPPTHHVFRAALTDDGRIAAFDQAQASGDVLFGFLPDAARPLLGADFGGWRGTRPVYAIEHLRTTALTAKLPVATGAWRGLGLLANVFAVESFIDELAHAAGRDPLEFRLAHLADDARGRRFKTALETVAQMSNWGGPVAEGRARGIACSTDVGTVAAQVVEVSLVEGAVRVHHVWVAVDPGLAVNPDGVRAQSEGGIIFALSATLHEEATVKDGRIESGNFDRYPLLRFNEAPQIDVAILRSSDTPSGIGEPPLGPTAAAVANAVFALTGRRLRRLPLRLDSPVA